MKKIAVIHDLSGLGKCSLTAAIPVISAMGVQACPLPTAILSNQTGYGSYFWDDYTDRMELIMDEWKKTGFTPDGVYTGFLGDARQVDLILKFVDMFCTEGTHILVDPVMGDRGETYKTYSETLCEKMRTLVREATVITPNLTEALLLLYGEEGMKERMKALSDMEETQLLKEIEKSGRDPTLRFGLESVVITGVEVSGSDGRARMGNLVLEKEKEDWSIELAGEWYEQNGCFWGNDLQENTYIITYDGVQYPYDGECKSLNRVDGQYVDYTSDGKIRKLNEETGEWEDWIDCPQWLNFDQR